jgi:hypothetical protein
MDVVSGADGFFYPVWADNSPNGLTPVNAHWPECDMATAKVRFLDFLVPAAPQVGFVAVNQREAQRSRVTSLQVHFDAPLTFAGAVDGAFTLTRDDGAPLGGSFTATASVVYGGWQRP